MVGDFFFCIYIRFFVLPIAFEKFSHLEYPNRFRSSLAFQHSTPSNSDEACLISLNGDEFKNDAEYFKQIKALLNYPFPCSRSKFKSSFFISLIQNYTLQILPEIFLRFFQLLKVSNHHFNIYFLLQIIT